MPRRTAGSGLGRIVYASSSAQLSTWLQALDAPPSPVSPLPIHGVAPNVVVEGPVEQLAAQVRELHHRYHDSG